MKILRPIITCLLILINFFSYAHDFRVAYFDIYKETGTNYYLKVSFDKDDIMTILKKEFAHLNYAHNVTEMNDCVLEYINQHLKLKFNQKTTGWVFIDTQANNEYFQYIFYLKTKASKVTKIQVQNDCFIKQLESHRNLIRVDLNGRNRIFQLNRRRKKTVIDY